MGWGWLFGGLIVMGLIVLAVVVVLLLVRSSNSGRATTAPTSTDASPTPRGILDERYARGELTTDEYQERLLAIRSDP